MIDDARHALKKWTKSLPLAAARSPLRRGTYGEHVLRKCRHCQLQAASICLLQLLEAPLRLYIHTCTLKLAPAAQISSGWPPRIAHCSVFTRQGKKQAAKACLPVLCPSRAVTGYPLALLAAVQVQGSTSAALAARLIISPDGSARRYLLVQSTRRPSAILDPGVLHRVAHWTVDGTKEERRRKEKQ